MISIKFNTMSRQLNLCPCKLYHILTVRQPIFQKLFRTLTYVVVITYIILMVNRTNQLNPHNSLFFIGMLKFCIFEKLKRMHVADCCWDSHTYVCYMWLSLQKSTMSAHKNHSIFSSLHCSNLRSSSANKINFLSQM